MKLPNFVYNGGKKVSIILGKSTKSFVSLTEKIDIITAVGLAVFSILGAISQLELDLIADRVKAGLTNARAKGDRKLKVK